MKQVDWRRVLKLSVYGALIAIIGLDLGAAWIYSWALTHPGCRSQNFGATPLVTPEEHWISINGEHQLKILYYPSQNGAVVIAMGGLGGSIGEALPWIDPLIETGYGVLQVDSRACAQPPTPVTVGFDEAYDAIAAVEFLTARTEVDPNRIGIMGFSMGGVASIRAAARDQNIKAVLAEGGYYNLGDDITAAGEDIGWFHRMFLYTVIAAFWIQTGVNPWESSPVEDLPKISPRPVLLIYGEHEVDSGGGYIQFNAALEPKEFWLVPGGYHGGNHLIATEEYKTRIVSFFNRTLTP